MDCSQHTFDDLIALAVAGNSSAFDEIYERTVPSIYKTVHFLVGEPSDVEDIVQETYVQLYNNLPKFKTGFPFQPWLTGIAIRQVNNYRRKKWRLFTLFQKATVHGKDVEADFSQHIVTKLENRELLKMVERLPYKQKQVIILLYLNEYSHEEVANILEIPIGTVKSRLHAGLKRLRENTTKESNSIRKVEEQNGY